MLFPLRTFRDPLPQLFDISRGKRWSMLRLWHDVIRIGRCDALHQLTFFRLAGHDRAMARLTFGERFFTKDKRDPAGFFDTTVTGSALRG